MAKKRKSKEKTPGIQRTDKMLVNQFEQAIQERDLIAAEDAFAGIEKGERKAIRPALKQLRNALRQDAKKAQRQAYMALDPTWEAIEILSQGSGQEPLGIAKLLDSLDQESSNIESWVKQTRSTKLKREADKLIKLRQNLDQARSKLRQRQQEYDRMIVVPKKSKFTIPWMAIFSILGLLAVLLVVFLGGAFAFGSVGQLSLDYVTYTPNPTATPQPTYTPLPTYTPVIETVIVNVEVTPVPEEITGDRSAPLTLIENLGVLVDVPSRVEFCAAQDDLELALLLNGERVAELAKGEHEPERNCTPYYWDKTEEDFSSLDINVNHVLSVVNSSDLGQVFLSKNFRVDPDIFVVTFPNEGENNVFPVFPWFVEAQSNQEIEVELTLMRLESVDPPIEITIGENKAQFTQSLALGSPLMVPTDAGYRFQWNRGLYDYQELPDGDYKLTFNLLTATNSQVVNRYFAISSDQIRTSSEIGVNFKTRMYPYEEAITQTNQYDSEQYILKSVVNETNLIRILGQMYYVDETTGDVSVLNAQPAGYHDRWCLIALEEWRAWTWCEIILIGEDFSLLPEIAPPVASILYESGGLVQPNE